MRKQAILLKAGLEAVNTVDFVDKLEFYYSQIGCDLIDITRPYALQEVTKKCKNFILIVDDEGAVKENPKLNVFATIAYGQPLFGNVIVAKEKFTPDGIVTVGLDDDDINEFVKSMLEMFEARK